ncbi:MAG: hypothetical protein IPK93_08340 [Solirubrobacterales bacterium]|nr:hypothetical protein [Solirubrobacterales bacterium]
MAIRRLIFLILLALIPIQGTATAAISPTGYNPKDLPTAGCFWTGPSTASNPKTNIAFPGTEISYWGAKFRTPPGAVLTLNGRYPHARYSSFNAYEDGGVSSSSLNDSDIKPLRGSINPSRPGKNRRAKNRRYAIRVIGGAMPSSPARNTLYAAPIEGAYQDILYRVYVPDRRRNRSGGTGIPKPGLKLADGRVLTGQALCDELNSTHDYPGNLIPNAVYQGLVNTAGKDPETNPALPEITFRKFFNLKNVFAGYGSPEKQQEVWAANPEEEGTQYNNNDARYMTGAYSFKYGEVLALRGRMPRTPKTRGGQKKTKRGQLVEWDLCGIQALTTTETYRCLFDEQVPLRGKRRKYVVAFAKAGMRPKNAKRKCGVAWLPADPEGDGAGRPDAGVLLTRNVLPSKSFHRSIFDVSTPFDARKTMGAYYPKGDYTNRKAFESHGCPYR